MISRDPVHVLVRAIFAEEISLIFGSITGRITLSFTVSSFILDKIRGNVK
jgi:hypothetical protein